MDSDVNSRTKTLLKEKVIENADDSIYVNDLDNFMDLFEEKRELFRLTKKYSNELLKKNKIVTNIN